MIEIVTGDLYDLHHASLEVCELQFRGFGRRSSFFGACSTVTTFADHLPVRAALQEPGLGRVLVVDGRGSLHTGLIGDHLAAIGAENGWAGVIVNGAIRDSTGIDKVDIGVKALGTTARRGWTPATAERDVPVMIGGATFSPGYWVYADSDCVIVSRSELDLSAFATAHS